MNGLLIWYYKNNGLIYKIFLFFLTAVFISYFFPRKGLFKYEFQKGKPWLHEDLIAPFGFPLLKTPEALEAERSELIQNKRYYFNYKPAIAADKIADIQEAVDMWNRDTAHIAIDQPILDKGKQLLNSIYSRGIVHQTPLLAGLDTTQIVYLIDSDRVVAPVSLSRFYTLRKAAAHIGKALRSAPGYSESNPFRALLINALEPDVFFDKSLTQKALDEQLDHIATTQGVVQKGTRIISKGDIVQSDAYKKLIALKSEYENQLYGESDYHEMLAGYFILVGISLFMLLLYLYYYERDIYDHNSQVTFIIFNIALMVLLAIAVKPLAGNFIYLVPFCMLPIVIRAFFDSRMALFAHWVAILIASFVAASSFEFIYLQLTAGVFTTLTTKRIFKRGDLFFTALRIVLVYAVAYCGLALLQDRHFQRADYVNLSFFAGNGLLILLAQPLIYLYERVFGLVSNISLLELSDSNSPLLRQLNQKAPGTMQHALQVANLAEQAAMEVGGNPLLVRIGALYHDIGKMNNPTYFVENQGAIANPHESLSPKESAATIIRHVIDGIELAKKNNIPDRVIDFIRTHHGTSLVYYFFEKYKEQNPDAEIDESDFRYPGPIPFSKETIIVMMADSIEAASRSLKRADASQISNLVDRVVDKQLSEGQFLNAEITMKEIQTVKKLLKKKLINIFHLRVEYPDQHFDKKSL